MPPKDRTLPSPKPPSAEPGTYLLSTPRLIIRRHHPSDAEAVAKAANHPSIALTLRDIFPVPYTLADAESFLNRPAAKSVYPTDTGIFIKPNTEDNTSSEPLYIGAMGVTPKMDVNYRTWELGYWFTPATWGKGYATEAVRELMRWSFETWPTLNRIEALVYKHNEGSAKVLTRSGFVQEGLLRGSAEKHGELVDEIVFGLVRSDVEASRK